MKEKTKTNKIKSIIFDVGGVLELPITKERIISDKHLKSLPNHCKHRNKGVHTFMAEKLRISLDQWFDSIDTTYANSITGKVSERQTLKIISKNLNISEEKLERFLLKAYKQNFKTNKELYNFTFNIKKQGYKIGILSDQWHISKKAMMPNKLTKKFDSVVVSCDVGMRKPNPKIYKLILKKLKLPAKNCIFIDNQQWNIKPAKKLGFHTILYKNNKQVFRQLSKLLK